MSTVPDTGLLFRARLHGLSVLPSEGRLLVRAAADVDPELRGELKDRREDLIALFDAMPLFDRDRNGLAAHLPEEGEDSVALREAIADAIGRLAPLSASAVALDMTRGLASLAGLVAAIDAGYSVRPLFGADAQADLFAAIAMPVGFEPAAGVLLDRTFFGPEDLIEWCRQHPLDTRRTSRIVDFADHPRGLLEALNAAFWGAPVVWGEDAPDGESIGYVASPSVTDLGPMSDRLREDCIASVLDTNWPAVAARTFFLKAPRGSILRNVVLPELQRDLAVELRSSDGTARRWDAMPLRIENGRLLAGGPVVALAERLGYGDWIVPGDQGSDRAIDCRLAARRGGDRRIELRSDGENALVMGRRARPAGIASAAERTPHVRTAHAWVRATPSGEQRVALAVVPASEVALDMLCDAVRAELDGAGLDQGTISIIPVTTIPFGSDGRPDEVALDQMPAIDDELLARWRKEQAAIASPTQAGIGAIARPAPVGPAHLLEDLLPPPPREPVESVSDIFDPIASGEPAICEGLPLDQFPDRPANLPRLLRMAANRDAGYIRLVEADGASRQFRYSEMLDLSERRATGLKAAGIEPGDRVVIQASNIGDLLGAYWACFLRGAVPHAMDPIAATDPEHPSAAMLLSMCERMDARAVLCSAQLAAEVSALLTGAAREGVAIVEIDGLLAERVDPDAMADPDGDATAVLFATSGTSGRPKLVPQTHGNLVAYAASAGMHLGLGPDDASFNWMPLDHVGGLSMFHLRDTLAGIPQTHCDKRYVLADPLRWLDVLSKDRITISWAPNFAFDLLAGAISGAECGRADWDLSCLRHVMNGGEMISRSAANAFTRLLRPHGFAQDGIRPIWGMSETCSAITIDLRFSPDDAASGPVVVGPPLPGAAVRIAREDGAICRRGETGALEVRGATITPGYFRDAAENAAAFTADGWFRTGDLGVMDADGRLTITGRSGNTIIINGINRSCQEIEEAIERDTGSAPGLVAVCAAPAPDGSGELVTVFIDEGEDPDDEPAMATAMARANEALIAATGIVADLVLPVARDAFTRTSLGKLQRNRMAKRLTAGGFDDAVRRARRLSGAADPAQVPDWFYRRHWIPAHPRHGEGTVLFMGEDADVAVLKAQPGWRAQDATLILPRQADRAERAAAMAAALSRDPTIVAAVFCPPADSHAGAALGDRGDAETRLLTALENVRSWIDVHGAVGAQRGSVPRLLVASVGAHPIDGYGTGAPGAAVVPPMVRSAALEIPGLAIRSIDLDPAEQAGWTMALRREALHDGAEPETAWRGHQRFAARLSRVRDIVPIVDASPLDRGLCVVIGGLGGIGMELCRWLHTQHRARIVIIGRQPLEGETDDAEIRRRRFAQLREAGVNASYHALDLTDGHGLATVIEQAERAADQPLAALFNLASTGHLDDTTDAAGSVQALTREAIEAMFAAKVATSAAAAFALESRPDSLLVLFSSVNGVFGGLGYTAYSAANAWLDRLAFDRRMKGARAISIGWTGWDDLGMSAGASDSVIQALEQAGFSAIGSREGLASLDAAISTAAPHMLVGLDGTRFAIAGRIAGPPAPAYRLIGAANDAAHLVPPPSDPFGVDAEFDEIVTEELARNTAGAVDAAATASHRIPNSTQDDAPIGDIERALAAMWCDVLRIASIGRGENFFVLGGNSILGTQMIMQLNAAFGVSLPVAALFEHATVARLAALIPDGATPSVDAAGPTPLPAGERALVPATPPQRRLWLLHQFEGAGSAYNVPMAVGLRGEIDADAIREALRYLAARHDAFRMRFVADEVSVQLEIQEASALVLHEIDATGWRPHELDAALDEAAAKPFDIETAPLAQAWLFRTGPEKAVYLLSMHHAIVDGWSLPVIADDFAAAYLAARAGRPLEPARPEIDYADYAPWLEERLASDAIARQETYWHDRLRDAPALLTLPTDRPRPPEFSYRGALHEFVVPAAVANAARRHAQSQGTTLFAALATALAIVLARYSGQRDIVLGTPVANRPHPSLDRIVGMFVNTVPLRIAVPPRASMSETLAATNRTIADALSNGDLPFERVLELADAPRDPSHSPLFQVMLVLQTAQDGEMAMPGLSMTPIKADPGVAKYDLSIAVNDGEGDLAAHIEYASDLFDRGTIARMSDDLVAVMDALAQTVDREIDTIVLSGAIEPADAPEPVPFGGNVYLRFARQCEARPDAPAIVVPGKTLSFEDLSARVEDTVSAMVCRGVRMGSIVGVTMERSADLVAAILACLRLGAVYLPMPTVDPIDHRTRIAEDAGCDLILSDGSVPIEGSIPILQTCEIAPVDRPSPSPAALVPSAPAYIIYTSGSTGTPKGVVISHGSLDNMAEASCDLFGDGAGRTMLRTARIGFDASIFELLLGVLRGAAECPLTHDQALSPVEATATMKACGVTDIMVPPSVLSLYDPAELEQLDRIIVGGEACPLDLVGRWAGDRLFINAYGPTETTICASTKRLTSQSERVAIGTAIRGLSLHVLNSRLQPQPPGAIGELCVGGVGVASHYHARPGLSAERFVPDRFSARPGAVLYRTGDLCRIDADGDVVYVGRADHQVKVRGHRIELSDIESVLGSDAAVESVAVLAQNAGDPGRPTRLVACIAASGLATGALPADFQARLRALMEARRPDYCMPHRFVGMASLPMNSNGKADHAAIQEVLEAIADEPKATTAPASSEEDMLVRLWADLLGREQVGVTDNFFELGGDSMVAMRLISRLRGVGYTATARQIFSLQTIRQLAPALEPLGHEADYQRYGDATALPMAHWLFEKSTDAVRHMNQVLTLGVAERLETESLVKTVRHVLAQYPTLSARFDREAKTMTIAADASGPPVTLVDLTALPASDRAGAARRAGQFAHRSFDPAEGRLARGLVFDGGRERWIWLFAHHLVSDIHSLSVLHEGLERALGQRAEGDGTPIDTGLPLVEWSRQMVAAASDPGIVAAETAHWRRLATDLGELPSTHSQAGATRGRVEHRCGPASEGLSDPSVHDTHNTRPIDLVVAAIAWALGRASNDGRVALTLEEHGRTLPGRDLDASRTIGWFTALHPILVSPRDGTADAVVRAVKDARLEAPNGGVGFNLMRYIATDREARDAARAVPLPQVLVNFSGSIASEGGEGSLLTPLVHDSGAWSDPKADPAFALEINCGQIDQRLWLDVSGNTDRYDIEQIARDIETALEDIVAACSQASRAVYTPRDFDDLDLDQDDLDLLIAEIDG